VPAEWPFGQQSKRGGALSMATGPGDPKVAKETPPLAVGFVSPKRAPRAGEFFPTAAADKLRPGAG
jgi:hypothetical protein